MIKIQYHGDKILSVTEVTYSEVITDSFSIDDDLYIEAGIIKSKGKKENSKKEIEFANQYAYIANITTEKKKKKATVVKPDGVMELDFDRGDLGTDDFDVAEKYAYIVNNEGFDIAVAWAKENGFVK